MIKLTSINKLLDLQIKLLSMRDKLLVNGNPDKIIKITALIYKIQNQLRQG